MADMDAGKYDEGQEAGNGIQSGVAIRVLGHAVLLALIIWIALIGIFAIEEIKSREGMLRVIMARQAELSAKQLALVGNDMTILEKAKALEVTASKLERLRQRTSGLMLVGSVIESGTLPDIACELFQIQGTATCRAPSEYRSAMRQVALQPLTAKGSNGALFAVLVITASLAGAVIRLSLEWDLNEKTTPFATIPRAIGGGIVCYLVLGGGKFPLSSLDVSGFTDASTGSLCGLLAGMFSDKVFYLLKDLFAAFVERLTPAKKTPIAETSAAEYAEGDHRRKGQESRHRPPERATTDPASGPLGPHGPAERSV
jgi:hypothetical protein